MIIDATDLILGKLGVEAAKKALEGEQVEIVNCEHIIITGKKDNIISDQKQRVVRGTHSRGPFFNRQPERFVKRSIRGMLPYKKARGASAFKRITCYRGVPENLKEKKMDTLKAAHLSSSNALEYITVGKLCRLLGGKQ